MLGRLPTYRLFFIGNVSGAHRSILMKIGSVVSFRVCWHSGPHRGGDAGDVSPGPTSFDPGKRGPCDEEKSLMIYIKTFFKLKNNRISVVLSKMDFSWKLSEAQRGPTALAIPRAHAGLCAALPARNPE